MEDALMRFDDGVLYGVPVFDDGVLYGVPVFDDESDMFVCIAKLYHHIFIYLQT